jgi:uncharacterized protein (UPF0332 family)
MAFDKTALMEYRISRAKETIEEARNDIKFNQLFSAENRIYYAIFYIVSALGLKYDFSTSKHLQLLGWFNKNIIKTNKVPQHLGRIYRNAFENRQKGDYEDFKAFSIDEVQNDFDNMLLFIETIEKLIRED